MAVGAIAAGWAISLNHPRDWSEVGLIILVALATELASLVIIFPVGVLTGVYRFRPRDFPRLRRRPVGLVATLAIILLAVLQQVFGTGLFFDRMFPRAIWGVPPWDAQWLPYWEKYSLVIGAWVALIIAAAIAQAAWNQIDHARRRKLVAGRRAPTSLSAG